MKDEATRLTAIEQARVARLLQVFETVQDRINAGVGKLQALKEAGLQCDGETITTACGRHKITLRASPATLRRLFDRWEKTPGHQAIARDYSTTARRVPRELIAELRTRSTKEGLRGAYVAIESLHNDWAKGIAIPGLGTWQEWWTAHHADKPLPAKPPRFPVSQATLYRYAPKKASALRAAGAVGLSAALDFLFSIERDSSLLKPGEVYVCDDVRLDLVCHDTLTGKLTEVRCYIMMDWGTRRVVAYTFRPGNGLLEADVRALIARGLRVGGVRADGTTHIFLERGTVALSEDGERALTMLSGGAIKVHRTGMIAGERWKGAGADKGVGNFRGKAPLESFMRKVHSRLNLVPGQRGNRYDNQPANLGFTGQKSATTPTSIGRWSEFLARLEQSSAGRLTLKLPFVWASKLETIFAEAMREYNATRGHQMQGFGTITVAVTPEGVEYVLPDGEIDAGLATLEIQGDNRNGNGAATHDT